MMVEKPTGPVLPPSRSREHHSAVHSAPSDGLVFLMLPRSLNKFLRRYLVKETARLSGKGGGGGGGGRGWGIR